MQCKWPNKWAKEELEEGEWKFVLMNGGKIGWKRANGMIVPILERMR